VPVFALAEIFGRTPANHRTNTADGHIAVTGHRNALTGWLVDRIARAAQPSPGDIAPLPPIVGAPATTWFEGVVWLDENESALLIAPHRLMSTPTAVDEGAGEDVFACPPSIAAAEPEPVAVVFSTPVLPASAVRRYALSGRQIAAIVQPTLAIAVPGCHDRVRGVMWWRRTVVPVIDFCDAPEGDAPRRRLIAQCGTRHGRSLVAFAIDSEVIMCRPAADHRLLPEVHCPPFAAGVFDVNGEAVALLDLDALLAVDVQTETLGERGL
jgi:chemotaxis signal transduction protein